MPVICPNCGAEVPDGARFCQNCGQPLGGAVGTDERKIVTVVFADLVDSTGLAQRLDPERAREVIAAFYDAASEELASLRGRAEKFIGDAVMAVFGLPTVHDDDAARAVRAALAIRDRTRRLGSELGLGFDLDAHAGIASGSVAVGESPAGQLLATGPTVNLAARLQDESEAGEILASDTTYQLARRAIEFGEPREIDAEGFDDPVVAYPVTRLGPKQSRRTIPIVGRRWELSLLRDTFDRAVSTRRPHLFTILGEAGIGKTRIIQEFLSGLSEDVTAPTGRAVSYGGEVTFWPIVEMLRTVAGIEERDDPATIRRRLRELAEACCPEDESVQVAARLAIALGVSEEALPELPADQAGEGFRALVEGAFPVREVQSGMRALLEGLGRRGPVVLVFEDAHAAQPAMLDLIEYVATRTKDTPLLVLVVAREDLLELRPGWGGGRSDAVTVRVEALDMEQSVALARASAGDEIDDSTARLVAERTGGNPFFIVETTGMILHAGREGGGMSALPPTVQAVVASRLDHLSREARELARTMAVFRPPIERSDLACLGDVSDAALAELEEEEILVRDDEKRDAWRFRHQFLRDVAYESLPKRERQRLHLVVADELMEGDMKGRYPQAFAYHLEQAARSSLDLDPNDRTLAERAVDALGEAGDTLRRRMELRSSIDLYERALSLAGPRESWTDREGGILAGIGESLYWLAEYDRARANLERALQLAPESDRVVAHASRFLADIVMNVDGDVDAAEALFERSRAAADRMNDPWVIARVRMMAAWVHSWRGDEAAAEKEWREVRELARANGDHWVEARTLSNLCSAISSTGDEREALALAEEALRIGEEADDPFAIGVALQHLGNGYRRMGEYDRAIDALTRAGARFEDVGARWEHAASITDRGFVRWYAGDIDGAERDLRAALSVMQALEEKGYLGFIHEILAAIAATRDDRQAAEEHLSMAESATSPDEASGKMGLLEARGDVLWTLGDREGAAAAYREALDLFAGSAYRNSWARLAVLVARRLGPEAAGGEDVVREAEQVLDRAGWVVPDPLEARTAGG